MMHSMFVEVNRLNIVLVVILMIQLMVYFLMIKCVVMGKLMLQLMLVTVMVLNDMALVLLNWLLHTVSNNPMIILVMRLLMVS